MKSLFVQPLKKLSLNLFNTQSLRGDIYGGITAAIVALPLALAFGVSSGAGAIAGVYGAICVGFFAAVFGGTASQVSGPTGPMTVVMAAVITDFIARDSAAGLTIAFTVVMLAGLIQILFGLFKLGRYFILVPYPVISGFMSGIGVIIILLQLAPLVGVGAASSIMESILLIPQLSGHITSTAALFGFAALAIIYLWPAKLNLIVPAPLVALVVGTVLVAAFLQPDAVAVIGHIPSGIPSLNWPTWSSALVGEMIGSAVLLAALGAIDSLLTSLVADNLSGEYHDSDQELVGQGIGNFVAGLFGALPGAGATMRTVTNIRAGGSTPVSGALHAIVLLVIVLGAGRYAENIPLAVLAGILIKVGIDIIDWGFIRRLHHLPLFSSGLMLGVLLLTVFIDLITAVLVGAFVANMVTIDRLTNLQLDGLKLLIGEDGEDIADEERTLLKASQQKTMILRITGPISFGVVRGMKQSLARHKQNHILIIDLKSASLVGITTLITLEEIVKNYHARGKHVLILGLSDKIQEKLDRLHILKLIPPEHFFESTVSALRFSGSLL